LLLGLFSESPEAKEKSCGAASFTEPVNIIYRAALLLSASLRRMLTLMVSIPTFIVGTLHRPVMSWTIFEMSFFVPERHLMGRNMK
jgi:hypothetical protein